MRTLDLIVGILLVIGGLNWGIVGLFDYNVIGSIFAPVIVLARISYILFGLCAVYELVEFRQELRRWHCRPEVPVQQSM